MNTTRSEWKGARAVFLLSVEWSGKVFHASTEPIQVPTNESEISFHGGLTRDPQVNEQLPDLGFQVDSYSTPISVYLNNVNISKQASNFNYLDESYCELSFVLVKGLSVSSYEDRIQIMNGVVKQPVFGHKDKSSNYVEFSLENQVIQSSMYQLSVGSGAVISSLELSAQINTAISPLNSIFKAGTDLIEVTDIHKGKNIPFIIGQSGSFIDEYNVLQYFGSTPAYVIFATSGATNAIWLAVASHDVDASTVRVFDQKGNWRTETIQKFIRRDGRVFCFVNFTHSALTFENPVDNQDAQYFISWVNGGGFKSNLTNAPISNGGDLCLYMLQLGNITIDFDSWIAIRQLLNIYKFAGYISNFELSPLEFLQNEIIPFLPISIIQSSEGLKPVYNVLAVGADLLAVDNITANQEFSLHAPISTIDDVSSIINDYTLEYVFDSGKREYKKSIRISGDTKDLYESVTSNQMCVDSFQRYGEKSIIESSNFIHDDTTASSIIFDKIKFHSQPSHIVSYLASSRYGYLNIGDIIRLTDSNSSLESRLVQVISKSYENKNWIFSFKIAPSSKQI